MGSGGRGRGQLILAGTENGQVRAYPDLLKTGPPASTGNSNEGRFRPCCFYSQNFWLGPGGVRNAFAQSAIGFHKIKVNSESLLSYVGSLTIAAIGSLSGYQDNNTWTSPPDLCPCICPLDTSLQHIINAPKPLPFYMCPFPDDLHLMHWERDPSFFVYHFASEACSGLQIHTNGRVTL